MRPNVQARFVTEGNANDVGVLMMRVEATPEAEPLTVANLTGDITGMAAIPEGEGNVQPLAMTPVEDPNWWADLSVGFGDLGFFAGRQLCSAGGTVSRRVSALCDHLSDVQEVLRPDTDAGFPGLSDIPDLGDLINRRRRPDNRRSPESPSRENRPPVPANDNNRPPVPANDNNRPPVPANDDSPQG